MKPTKNVEQMSQITPSALYLVNVSVGVTTVNMSGIKNISKAELSN
jgi:hypothetical protein